MPVSDRQGRSFDLLWRQLKIELEKLGRTAQLRMLNAGGDTMDAFAREASLAQGAHLAIQDVLAVIGQLEDAEAHGQLGDEETDDADDRRGTRGNQAGGEGSESRRQGRQRARRKDFL